jgi:hypothetical protein
VLTGVVCYIERAPGGNALRRVRLVGPELDQTWVAPSIGPDDPGKPAGPGEQLSHIRSAAAWIAEELAPLRELAAICLDAEGGVCAWVSAPSTDQSVLMAAIRQSGSGSPHAGAETSPASSGFGLLPDDALGLGAARSLQALAEPERANGTALLSRTGKQAPLAPRRRMGVLSIADAPVRVLLDELDALKIGVGAVLSFWHAAALAWDPSVERAAKKRASEKYTPEAGELEPIVVEPDAPVTATVMIDPAGRLSWGWSQAGELVAAGSMRLRTHTFSRTPPPPPAPVAAPLEPLLEEPLDALGTRRIVPEEPVETVHATECSSGDIGRLVMDWLSWSVQVGRTPDRIVCIGPATITHRPAQGEGLPAPGTLAHALSASWPSAAVDAALHDDPIGATLNRLRALPMFQPARSGEASDTLAPNDPRRALVSLTRRPGRLDRTMHLWATLAILAAAAAVFIHAKRVGSGIAALRTQADAVQSKRTEALKSVEDVIPALSKSPDPVGMLSGKIGEYADQFKRLNAGPALLPKVLPVLEILQEPEFANVEITTVSVGEVRILVSFTVPETEDLTPAALRTRLDQRFGAGVWTGTWGVASRGRRPYDVYWVNPGGTQR